MPPFVDRLLAAVGAKNSRVCVGIDPRPENAPPEFRRRMSREIGDTCQALLDFHRTVFEVVAPHAACVKLNAAYFERLGPYGAPTIFSTIHSARQFDLPVILDVKRADIGESSKAYAEAWLDAFPGDAVTVNPYLGTDGVKPFVDVAAAAGKGLFVLVRTSNDSAAEIQELKTEGGEPLYLRVADLVRAWNEPTVGASGYGCVGAVVSGRHPDEAARLRAALPRSLFLVPGYGAQGGTAATLKPVFGPGGLGAVVNSSRGIVYAYLDPAYRQKFGEQNWEKATEAAVVEMKDALNAAIS